MDKAVDTLPAEMLPFFQANRQFLVQHVADAAASEAKNPAERRNDFIQLDHYGQFPFASFPAPTPQQLRSLVGAASKRTG